MKALLGIFKNKWVTQGVGVIALSVLIWFVGPLIAIAGREPLASEWGRGLTITAIAVTWVIVRLLAEVRAGRRDRQLMTDLTGGEGTKTPEEEATEEEIELLRKTFEDALRILRESRAQGRRGAQFLYELPWYVIIGAPGSGKTTALVNSGLKFPLAERFGKNPIKGVSGTRNCDWWFTDEAVFLDTAGRYTTQDSHQAVDAAAWQGFLGLVKKHRPRRPLNGVLVAMSLSDLLQQTEEERLLHAKAIRRRIAEIYQTLGVRIPVYMLFTKCDLVAGFTDFFADLDAEGRAQVWGETFPSESVHAAKDLIDTFDAAYEELLKRLDRRTFRRIFDERDIQRRTAALEFPQQMALLKPTLMAFLRETYGFTRFETPVLLRGVYFTSGTQEGTPIDRVMGILATAFHLDRRSAPVYSGRGKSYFLTRLLRGVVFPEAELAGLDPKVERRQRLLQFGAYAGAGLFACAMIALWTWSYARNHTALAGVGEWIDRYRAVTLTGTNWMSDMKALLPKMRSLREAKAIYATGGWTMRMGLSQERKITSALDDVYEKLLQNHFLRLIKVRLEQRMVGAEAENLDVLYELLRVYLMLGEPKRLDAQEARSVTENLLRVDWERLFATEPESLAELSVHLSALLQLPPEPIALNGELVSAVRARLTQVPRLVQTYNHFKAEKLALHTHDLKMGAVLGRTANQVFVAAGGRDVADVVVPGFFTAKGYAEYFLQGAFKALKDALEQDWVLGDERRFDPAEIDTMRRDFEKLYLRDYRDAWTGLLATVQLRRGLSINQTADILGALSAKDSPLRALLETVEKNTSLTRVSASVADALASQLGVKPVDGKLDPRSQKLLDSAKIAAGIDAAAQDPVRDLERQFESLNSMVRKNETGQAPIDDLLQTLKELHVFALQMASGGPPKAGVAGAGGSPAMVVQQLKNLPDALKGPLASLATSVDKQTGAQFKEQLNAMLHTGVSVPCRQAFEGRYPFVKNSALDVALADFAKFFSANGIFENFFQTNLKELVDTARTEWRQFPVANPSFALSRAALAQFQNAARIRDAFFSMGSPLPKVQFDLRPLALDSTVALFSLKVEGQEITYRHGPEQVGTFQWPGPMPHEGVRLVFRTLAGQEFSSPPKQGPWALFRLLDESSIRSTGDPLRFIVTFRVGELHADYELRAGSVENPFNLTELRAFRCPEAF